MNKKSIITLFLLLVSFAVRAQVQPTTELVGSWSGKLNIGAISLTLVLNLEQADGYVVVQLTVRTREQRVLAHIKNTSRMTP